MNRTILITVLFSFFGFVQLAFADTVVLTWTAVGDDGKIGTAYEYDIRYSTTEITSENFYSASRYDRDIIPQPAGSREEVIVDGLIGGTTYYFALKVRDYFGNWSLISNVIQKTACEEGCVGRRGNIDGDPLDRVDIEDLLYLVTYMFFPAEGYQPHCKSEADIDGSGEIDLEDLLYLVDYMFAVPAGAAPEYCPSES